MPHDVLTSVQSLTSSNYMTGEPDYEAWARLVASYNKTKAPSTTDGVPGENIDVQLLTDQLVLTLERAAREMKCALELQTKLREVKRSHHKK